MSHELREVLEVAPESIYFFDGTANGDGSARVDNAFVGELGDGSLRLPRQLFGTHDVERGHGKHVGGCEERSAAVVVRVRERAAEKGEVEGIAGDTRPDRFLRLLIRQNRDAVTNLPHSHGAHE